MQRLRTSAASQVKTSRRELGNLWFDTAPPAPLTLPLRDDAAADVTVIGAGYTGLSTALHLAQARVRVVVLEAVEVGYGGSGRNVGLVNAGMWIRPSEVCAALGPVYGERLLSVLGEAPNVVFDLINELGLECEAQRFGTLHCAVGKRGFRDLALRAEQWKARGAPVHLLGPKETALKFGSSAYCGSLLDLRAGTIQPLAYARGLAHAALNAGACIHTGSPVVSAQRDFDKWTVRTDTGSVRSEWLVIATDAYASGPWSPLRKEQVDLPYFNVATAPLASSLLQTILPEKQGAWDTRTVLSSVRLDRAGRLIFGSVGALEGLGTYVHTTWAKRALRQLFPQLGKIDFEHAWYGRIGLTRGHVPRFLALAPNAIAFGCYNGRGIAPGTIFGRLLAQYMTGSISDPQLPLPIVDCYKKPAFRKLRSAAYSLGSQLFHLAGARP